MPSDITKQAVKCVNEFVERADGNWKQARKLWCEEVGRMPYGYKYKQFVHEVELAFESLRPADRD